MLNKEGIAELKERLRTVRDAATNFFSKVQERQDQGEEYPNIWEYFLTPNYAEREKTYALP